MFVRFIVLIGWFLFLTRVSVIATGLLQDGNPLSSWSSTRRSNAFPFLTWVRDGMIEWIFGRSSGKQSLQAIQDPQSMNLHAGEVVLRFAVTSSEEEQALAEATACMFLDVWSWSDESVDIRLHRDDVGPLLGLLPRSLRNAYASLVPDLGNVIQATLSHQAGSVKAKSSDPTLRFDYRDRVENDDIFFQDYQPLSVIIQWMRLLEAMFPSFVTVASIGKSYEGRDILSLRLTAPGQTLTLPRKTIVVVGGMHAREWIGTSTVNYVAWSFITSYGKEHLITKFLNEFDMVFIPAINPDGTEYTWQVDRLWRKSRQHTSLRYCRGLDLDHAFGFEWDGAGTSQTDPCSESYGGEKPFQAVEAFWIAEWARNESLHGTNIIALLDLHSYSQQVLYPYSFSCSKRPPNLENLQELGTGLAKALRLANGEPYSVSSACEGAALDRSHRIESGGGSLIDWASNELHVKYSFQIKLRDMGSYGFLLPREYIVPTGQEMVSAMKYLCDYLLGNNGIESFHPDTKDFQKQEQQQEPFNSD